MALIEPPQVLPTALVGLEMKSATHSAFIESASITADPGFAVT
jgi:hypothetical protein